MKKAFFTLVVLCCIGLRASCQIRNTNELEIDSIQMDDDTNAVELIDPIEIGPQFPGGIDSMYAFIARNFRLPQKCGGKKGTIWVRFDIERDGTVSNAEVMRGLGNEYDEEALRVVRMMPRWIPSRFAGSETPIRSQYVVPIRFNLE